MKRLVLILAITVCVPGVMGTTPTPYRGTGGNYVWQRDMVPWVGNIVQRNFPIEPISTPTPTVGPGTPTYTAHPATNTPVPPTCCAPFVDTGTHIEQVDPTKRITLGTTGIQSYRFYLPWTATDDVNVLYAGSSDSANNKMAVTGDTYSGIGIYGRAYSGFGVSGASQYGHGGIFVQGNVATLAQDNNAAALEIQRLSAEGTYQYTETMIVGWDYVPSGENLLDLRTGMFGNSKFRVDTNGNPYVRDTPIPLNTCAPPPPTDTPQPPTPTLIPTVTPRPTNPPTWTAYPTPPPTWTAIPTLTPIPATPTLIPTENPNTCQWCADRIKYVSVSTSDPPSYGELFVEFGDPADFKNGTTWLLGQPTPTNGLYWITVAEGVFFACACWSPVPTATSTNTPSPTPSSTLTSTPTNTATPTTPPCEAAWDPHYDYGYLDSCSARCDGPWHNFISQQAHNSGNDPCSQPSEWWDVGTVCEP